jgi:hypothetical protein
MIEDSFIKSWSWPPKEFQRPQSQTLDWNAVHFSSLNFVKGINYRDRMENLLSAFESAEYQSVRDGKRTATVSTLSRDLYKRLQLRYPDLYFYIIRYVKAFTGFAHAHSLTTQADPNAYIHFAMSNKPLDVDTLRQTYGKGGAEYHHFYGDILGYPKCCQDWFIKWWYNPMKDGCNTHHDIIWHENNKTEDNKIDGFPECNPFLRYRIRAIPYMPCSTNCEASKTFAQNVILPYIKEDDRAFLLEKLGMPMRWSRLHGIVTVETKDFWLFDTTDYTDKPQEAYINGYSKQRRYGDYVQKVLEKQKQA